MKLRSVIIVILAVAAFVLVARADVLRFHNSTPYTVYFNFPLGTPDGQQYESFVLSKQSQDALYSVSDEHDISINAYLVGPDGVWRDLGNLWGFHVEPDGPRVHQLLLSMPLDAGFDADIVAESLSRPLNPLERGPSDFYAQFSASDFGVGFGFGLTILTPILLWYYTKRGWEAADAS